MFWKNVNLFRFKSLSLVTKLMLFYSVSTIGLLSTIGVFLYPTFIKITEKINGSEASHITTECYEKIIIILLFGSLFAVIFGHFIARKGLNRMREFENKMEKISAESLHERINLNEWPKELKSFGKKFNTMLDRIQISFIQLSQFSSDIAHELRTPVNNLIGMTEIALSQERNAEAYQRILEKHIDEYQHLSKLIENLLFLARSDHGQLTLNQEVFFVHDEVLKLCDYYQALAEDKEIELSCSGAARLSADPIHFKRAISNLISNALKYTKPQGKVSIYIESTPQGVRISVQDTGVGITQEHIPRIFDRFYRIDPSRTIQSGGLGLGLAIVKSIVDSHQGTIMIESKPDLGTTVYLQFPSAH